MVLELDGISVIDTHAKSEICTLICLRDLSRSTRVENSWLISIMAFKAIFVEQKHDTLYANESLFAIFIVLLAPMERLSLLVCTLIIYQAFKQGAYFFI